MTTLAALLGALPLLLGTGPGSDGGAARHLRRRRTASVASADAHTTPAIYLALARLSPRDGHGGVCYRGIDRRGPTLPARNGLVDRDHLSQPLRRLAHARPRPSFSASRNRSTCPSSGYDEPQTLPSAISSICPVGPDGEQLNHDDSWPWPPKLDRTNHMLAYVTSNVRLVCGGDAGPQAFGATSIRRLNLSCMACSLFRPGLQWWRSTDVSRYRGHRECVADAPKWPEFGLRCLFRHAGIAI